MHAFLSMLSPAGGQTRRRTDDLGAGGPADFLTKAAYFGLTSRRIRRFSSKRSPQVELGERSETFAPSA